MITGRPAELAAIIRTCAQMELAWKNKIQQSRADRKLFTGWMPFPIFEYAGLVLEALPEVNGNEFLEIGCGIGTKMLLTAELIPELRVSGIERNEEYAAAARRLSLNVAIADALNWNGYAGPDWIWFNRVFRDVAAQADLEAKVLAETKPGVVLMCANLETGPPRSWYPILEDTDRRVWIVQKPFTGTGS